MRLISSIVAIATASLPLVQGALFADSYRSRVFALAAIYDDTTQATTFTLASPQLTSTFGWIGIGTGQQMAGSNMVISWVNADNSVTVSNRAAVGEIQPLTTNPLSLPGIQRDLSSTAAAAAGAMITWQQPGFPPAGSDLSKVDMIWAVNPTDRPSGPADDATIFRHRNHGNIRLDLTKAYTGTTAAPGAPPSIIAPGGAGGPNAQGSADGGRGASNDGDGGSDSGGDYKGPPLRKMNKYNRVVFAHLFFMVFGWLLFFPAGILIARFGRLRFTWFPVHRLVQTVGIVVVIIGMFLGFGIQWTVKGKHLDEKHHKLGLALCILAVFQGLLGQFGHVIRPKTGSRIQNYIHILLGLTLLPLATYNMHLGFGMWRWKTGNAPRIVVSFISLRYEKGGLALTCFTLSDLDLAWHPRSRLLPRCCLPRPTRDSCGEGKEVRSAAPAASSRSARRRISAAAQGAARSQRGRQARGLNELMYACKRADLMTQRR